MLSTCQVAVEDKLLQFRNDFSKEPSEDARFLTDLVKPIATDNSLFWDKLQKELERVGITKTAFDLNRDFIQRWITKSVEEKRFVIPAPDSLDGDDSSETTKDPSSWTPPIETLPLSDNPSTRYYRSIDQLNNNDFIVPWKPQLVDNVRQNLLITTWRTQIPRLSASLDSRLHPSNSLLHAVEVSDRQKVMKILRSKIKLSSFNAEAFETTLVWATRAGESDIAETILNRRGFNLNASVTDTHGIDQTALVIAAGNRDTTILKLLLSQANIDVNACPDRGRTALYNSAEIGRGQAVEILLSQPNIDVNIVCDEDKTPLDIAVASDHTFVVSLLLDHPKIGASITRDARVSPLAIAVARGSIQTVDMLLDHPDTDVNDGGSDGLIPIHIAIHYGYEPIFLRLLKVPNININARNASGGSAVIVAARINRADMLQHLLAQPGTKIDSIELDEASEAAFLNGHSQISRLILKYRAYLKTKSGFETGPNLC
jgi:ankyrin repeat protein